MSNRNSSLWPLAAMIVAAFVFMTAVAVFVHDEPTASASQFENHPAVKVVSVSSLSGLKCAPSTTKVYLRTSDNTQHRCTAADTFTQITPLPAKRYVALLTQTGTSAPVATVLENTLGGTVTWARASTGSYTATLTGAFTSGKTTVLIGQVPDTHTSAAWQSANVVSVFTSDFETTGADATLTGQMIEIRVYP